MGLKEILAAKKAAAEQVEKESNNVDTKSVSSEGEKSSTNVEHAVLSTVQSSATTNVQSQPPASIETVQHSDVQKPNANDAHSAESIRGSAQAALSNEVLVDANGKPLSGFALVKRRKELAAQAALAPVIAEAKKEEAEGKPIEPFNAQFLEKIQEPILEAQPDGTGTVPDGKLEGIDSDLVYTPPETADYTHESYIAAAPETKQAYSDIKQRIDALVSLSDLDLKTAMTELKKSLMQNTNAVALMLPSDIGQMVIALRKMTGVELAKAEEKKTGKKTGKSKEVIMDADALEKAFEEL